VGRACVVHSTNSSTLADPTFCLVGSFRYRCRAVYHAASFEVALSHLSPRTAVQYERVVLSHVFFAMDPVFVLLDNRRFSFADVCKLRNDSPALYAGERSCPKLRKRKPRSQRPLRPIKGIRRPRLGRKKASSRLCRERHTIVRLESWALSGPFKSDSSFCDTPDKQPSVCFQ
jgi:hypothetical protein